ncbi:hypothetical protein JCM8547_006316 [Rhodosporidiobolus lusitaniae]
MLSTPSKRTAQRTPASPAPFVEALSRLRSSLRSSLAFISNSLSRPSISTSSSELLAELDTLHSRIHAFEASVSAASASEKDKAPGWKDELDQAGTLLWNKSTAMRHGIEDGDKQQKQEELKLIAELRRAGYHLIRLGTLEPLSPDSHLSLLTLSTKTAAAFLSAGLVPTADALLRDAATHASHLPLKASVDPSFAKERGKALLAHYCSRIRTSMASGTSAVASWVKDKAVDLVKADEMGWREIEKLAQTAYDVGVQQLRGTRTDAGTSNTLKDDLTEALDWLQLALELLERGEGNSVQAMQLTTLKALAQAYIDGKQWGKAEEVLKQILEVDSSPALHRRMIKLVLARKGGDGELDEAFIAAAHKAFKDPEDGLRRTLRFDILNALCSAGSPQSELLGQLFATAMFCMNDSDVLRLKGLLESASTAAPNVKLSPSTAFLCITYIWRQGDKAHKEQRWTDAAEWYLLAAHPLFSSIDAAVFAKSIRKAALFFIEARENHRAEQILQLPAAGADFAKTHFVRFYNYTLQGNTAKAAAVLTALSTAPDFTLNLLLWCAKTANEANNKELLALVLGTVVDQCKKGGAEIAGTDLMVVIRCLIRLYLTRIDEADEAQTEEFAKSVQAQLEGALALAKSLALANPVPESLSKDVAWLYKSAFNLTVRFTAVWSNSTLISLYGLTASLIEVDVKISGAGNVEQAAMGKLWTCKFAALAGKFEEAKKAEGAEQKKLYKVLVEEATSFIAAINESASASTGDEKTDSVLHAAYAVLVEAQTTVGDWKALVVLVENFEESPHTLPVSLLKLVTDKATSSTTCPRDELCSILRKTLALLYSRQDLDVASMSLWLRMIVSALLDREPDAALEYVKNAAQLSANSQGDYPQEEIDWLLSTTWDYGIERYAAGTSESGSKWCDMAVELAKASGASGMGRKLEDWHNRLRERYADEEDERMA